MRLLRRIGATVCGVLLSAASFAGTHTWQGSNNGVWSNAANWQEGTAPAQGEASLVLIFPAPASAQVTQNDVSGLSIQSISLPTNNGGPTYTLQGNAVTLTGNPLTTTYFGHQALVLSGDGTYSLPTTVSPNPTTMEVAVAITGNFYAKGDVLTIISNINVGPWQLHVEPSWPGAKIIVNGSITGNTGPSGGGITTQGTGLIELNANEDNIYGNVFAGSPGNELCCPTLAVNGSMANTGVTPVGGIVAGTGPIAVIFRGSGIVWPSLVAGTPTTMIVGDLQLYNSVNNTTLRYGAKGASPGQYDQIVVTSGKNSYYGGGSLDLKLNYAPTVGDNLVVLKNQTGAPFPQIGSYTEGSVVTTSGSIQFVITYKGGGGTDVALIAKNTPAVTISSALSNLLPHQNANNGTQLFVNKGFVLTAMVAGSGPSPTGMVTFSIDGTQMPGSFPLSGGRANALLTGLGLGKHSITAFYSGDGNYAAAQSVQALALEHSPRPR